MAYVTLAGIEKTFRDTKPPVTAVRDLRLAIGHGERIAVVGPSGCGKTTLLRLIAGLERLDAGSIVLAGRDLAGVAPEGRHVGMLFAGDALFAHLSTFENIAYPLRTRRARDIERRVRANAVSTRVSDVLERYPGQLSSGQRQRVALARALAMEPALLLLDEPFSRLDAPLRSELRTEFAQLLTERALTTLFVTHDQSEAIGLAQRIALMRDGTLEQVGTSRELYESPNNTFVARFIGSPPMALVTPDALGWGPHEAGVCIGVRPEAVQVVSDGNVAGIVRAVDDFGADAYAYVDGAFGSLVARLNAGDMCPTAGQHVALRIDRTRTHVFAADGSRLRSGAGDV